MGKGRVHELHPRNFVGCMGFKTRWPPRQQTREEGTLLPFHGSICGCPAEGAFPWGPCAVRSEEHTSELQSPLNLVCRLLLEKKKKKGKIESVGGIGRLGAVDECSSEGS